VDTQLFTATWSSSTYKYLRIRESGGTIFYDSSTNGTSWTNRASIVGLPFAVTALYVDFGATCGNVASPGSLRLDDVNLILPAPSATWRYTTGDWSITNRLRPVTLASDGGKQGVIVTADTMDSSGVLGGTVRYFAGPLGSSSGGYLQLTEYASLVLAQASSFPIPTSGRVDLPAMVDARYMRLYHRSTDASAHTIYEFVPRRIVQADDIEAESIRAINISAGAVTADKIFVLTLGAITANIGQLNIDLTGYIWQGTGTAAVPTTGLKIFNSGGVGKLSTYNTGVEQVTLDTDGKLKAGAGAVVLDASGIAITQGSSTANLIRFVDGSGNREGYIQGGSGDVLIVTTLSDHTTIESVVNVNRTPIGSWGVRLRSFSSGVMIEPGSAQYIFKSGSADFSTGINLGAATGAGTGALHMGTYIQQPESSQPSTPAANTMRQWTTDDGAGNTMVAWVDSTGAPLGFTTATTASATAGGNGAPPAQVAGYLIVFMQGARRKIAYYNI
jgi:hypothetical protein